MKWADRGIRVDNIKQETNGRCYIKLNYITPAIQNGWKGHITMETRNFCLLLTDIQDFILLKIAVRLFGIIVHTNYCISAEIISVSARNTFLLMSSCERSLIILQEGILLSIMSWITFFISLGIFSSFSIMG